jgi:hypothetical protein
MNQIIKDLSHLTLDKIRAVLETNAEIYSAVFPDLEKGISKTLKEIKSYRENTKGWKELRKEKVLFSHS